MSASRFTTPLGVGLLFTLLSGPLLGASVGFELRIGGGKNAPILHLLNESTSASITHFEISLGNPDYIFDNYIIKSGTNVDFTSCSIDEIDDGIGSNELCFDFTNFEPDKRFRVKSDIDLAGFSTKENFNELFFHVGGSSELDRPMISVDFSDGTQLSDLLPRYDEKPDGSYIFALSRLVPGQPHVVPLPPGLWAGLGLLGALGAVGLARRSFRRRAS